MFDVCIYKVPIFIGPYKTNGTFIMEILFYIQLSLFVFFISYVAKLFINLLIDKQ